MSEYKRGTRVVVTEDIPEAPEGTPGKCGRGLGFSIKRYRVRFDNGGEAISVAHTKLVPEDEWPQFLAKRTREAIEAAQERARVAEARAAAAESRGLPAASTEGPAGGAAGDDGAAPAPAAASPADTSGDEGGDPRLAALLARSKSARAATGVPAPEKTEPASAAAAAPAREAAAAPDAAPAAPPARTTAPAGPERVEIPEFIPGPEVDPGYAPAANRVSELLNRVNDGA